MVQVLSYVPSTPGKVGNDLWGQEVAPIALGTFEDPPHSPNEVRPSMKITIPADLLKRYVCSSAMEQNFEHRSCSATNFSGSFDQRSLLMQMAKSRSDLFRSLFKSPSNFELHTGMPMASGCSTYGGNSKLIAKDWAKGNPAFRAW